MILIEIHDSEDFRKNIYGALYLKPHRMIFLHKTDVDPDVLQGLTDFFAERLPATELHLFSVDFSDWKALEKTVLPWIRSEGERTFLEVCGGEDIVTDYVKSLCEKHGTRIVSIDPLSGRLIYWEKPQIRNETVELPALSFQDIIRLQGGAILRHLHTCPEADRYDDILNVGAYIFRHLQAWKETNWCIQACVREKYFTDDWTVSAPLGFKRRRFDMALMEVLYRYGFLKTLYSTKDRLYFRIADEFSKGLLLISGAWLEMFLYVTAQRSGQFSEVYASVCIDWDRRSSANDVINEMDLIAVKEGIPIFVSCKMTEITPSCMNELVVCAERFAGKRVHKVLATTELIRRDSAKYQRCCELGIRIIDYSMLSTSRLKAFYDSI